jgi:GAF domain-containing protein
MTTPTTTPPAAGPPSPTLAAIITAAVGATGATAGWILEHRGDELAVVAAQGGSERWAASLLGRRTGTAAGTAALVVQSGQPVALQPGSGALRDELGAELLARNPVSLVCVPCLRGEVAVGALQLVDKAGGGPFDFDDVELATLLGTIAGAALGELGQVGPADDDGPPTPEGLGRDLARLAEVDPDRFAAAARVLAALLA